MPTLRLDTWLSRWLLLCLLFVMAPAVAQQSTPAADADAPAYSTLADMLENEKTRQTIIDQLRAQAAQENTLDAAGASSAAAIADDAPSDQTAAEVSFPRRLADATSHIAANLGGQLKSLSAALVGLFSTRDAGASGPSFDTGTFLIATLNFALVVIGAFVALFVLRRLASPLFGKLGQWSSQRAEKSALLRTVVAVVLAALVDIVVVVLAYVAGNLLATFAIGEAGNMATRFSLFLNAFLMIELFKAALRMLFSSHYEGLRLMPIASPQASYCNRFLARLAGFIGYGMLVVVPIINFNLSPALGQGLGTLIMLLALIYATTVILKHRVTLRDVLMQRAENADMSASRFALRLLGRIWHVLALAYALVVFAVTVLHPETALPYVLLATLKTVITVGIGMLVSGVLTQLIGRRIRLSGDIQRRLPLLETRLNAYVPTALKVIRAIILIVVAMFVLSAWQVFDLAAWYASEAGANTVGTTLNVIIILLVAIAAWIGLASLIEHRLNADAGTGEPSARAKTLLSLFRNALAIALITMTAMIILAEIGINIGPLIAGAGVLGLAIGFGSQKLVQDVITGVFIQLENAMNTGDVVTVGGTTGTAERISIRSVGIRDLSGTYHIVPFSSVDTVSNYMREFGNHVGEYGIAYRESIDDAIEQLQVAFDALKESEHGHKLLEPLSVAGVTALADSSVNIRVIIKTTPGDQWAVGRAYNRLVKLYFDAAGIEIPFPHTTLYFGQEKDGSAPPANLRILSQKGEVVDSQSPSGNASPSPDAPSDENINPEHTKPDNDETPN
ncbi:small conductance mechanosensitive channel [Chromohalobacter marismortui]|uniref:Small conductance mechanosensitive channel n=1 Tax=Chromohalobacter marismortui TaxID=42055 RepID=A0A4R7NEP7_9GAMM|nr:MULTISPECIES: mechanosensitive channel protein [Chromohalobacter]MCI0510047.1 mechanosensitive channel protein [Chromohalobacter sp.]MCI0593794.1 mechanosensitive channel protein [Chromohalobacter sp.]TDU18984.1 small conductance mechanosensitive channel [Chromohalobacter marismortui]